MQMWICVCLCIQLHKYIDLKLVYCELKMKNIRVFLISSKGQNDILFYSKKQMGVEDLKIDISSRQNISWCFYAVIDAYLSLC